VAGARQHVADSGMIMWGRLAGDDRLGGPLDDWFACYQGSGLGAVTREGFPEPVEIVGSWHNARTVGTTGRSEASTAQTAA